MSAETTALIVALAGVLGTLSATLITQRAAFKVKQLESDDLQRERSDERDEAARQHTLQLKRDTFAALNTAARRLRAMAHEALLAREQGDDYDLAKLIELRTSYRDALGQAQMILSDRGLIMADEANDALALVTGVARGDLRKLFPTAESFNEFRAWIDDPLVDSLRLLRRALREELGVVPESEDLLAERERLAAKRLKIEETLRPRWLDAWRD
ncbi:hypothetical protein ACFXPR_01300 [Nocardia tengchongensis]|uniref:hypothetical protein n=1 Tax=Nocardia tengchongensis TaxID=2055889 RepID=UPI0036C84D33